MRDANACSDYINPDKERQLRASRRIFNNQDPADRGPIDRDLIDRDLIDRDQLMVRMPGLEPGRC